MNQGQTKVLGQNSSSQFVLLCLEGHISGLESESRIQVAFSESLKQSVDLGNKIPFPKAGQHLTFLLKFCRWVLLMKLSLRHKRKTDCVADVFFYEDSGSFDSIITELSNLSAASDEAARQEDASPASAPALSILSLATLRSRDYEFPRHRRYYLFQKTNTVWAAFFVG